MVLSTSGEARFLDSEVSGFAMDWHLVLAQQQSLE